MDPQDLVKRIVEAKDDACWRRLLEEGVAAGDADVLLTRLKSEADRHWHIDPHVSLRCAEALIYGAELAARPDHAALGVMARGDALRYLGHYPESLGYFEEAAQAFLAQGDEVGWARTRIGWIHSMHLLGRADEALPVADRAHDILVRHGEWFRAATLDLNTGVVCKELGRYARALELYGQAEHLYGAMGGSALAWVAKVKENQANVLTLMGEFQSALRLHDEARRVFAELAETVAELQQTYNIANVYESQGQYTRALRLFGDVFAAAERAGLEANAAWAALEAVDCYLGLNRNVEALEWAEEAAAKFECLGTPTEAAKARFYCALARARLGNAAAALVLLGEAAKTFDSAGLSAYVGIAALQRGSLHLSEGSWSAAEAEASRAYDIFAERGLSVRRAQAELIRARAALGLNRHLEAAGRAQSALAIARERGVDWLAPEAHHVLARVAGANEDAQRALEECDAAIRSIQRVQGRLATELRVNFLDDKLAVYQDAIDWALKLGQARRAFEYLERAKSRALVDYLAGNPEVRLRARDSTDQELLDELARLRAEHNWFYNRLYGYGFTQQADKQSGPAETAALQAGVRDRERRIARLLDRLALRDAHALEGLAPPSAERPVELPPLDERTVVLEYYLQDGAGAVFVVSGGRLEVVPLPVRLRDLRRLLNQWQLNLDATARALASRAPLGALARNARGILSALYRSLVEPVADRLAGCEKVVAVPHGLTHAFPFHALYDGHGYLIEGVEVSVCPSSSLLGLCLRSPRRQMNSALVVAYSDGGRLPHVLDEARVVSTLLPGERYVERGATRAAVIEAAARHGVLHLAAHAEARLDNPTFAHVKLADSQLSAADVLGLPLDGALVTLSACETGRAAVTGGDELLGLSRGFLHAGASTIVQSLWRVEDGSTARLMARFYEQLKSGRTKGAALREAQLALLAEGVEHPYLWAPFQLVGDGGPAQNSR